MELVEFFKVVILGIVEGITEWLPISSTGHLVLMDQVVNLAASDSFKEMFNVVIQLGAILAVVVLYFKKLWPFHSRRQEPAKTWFANPAQSGAAAGFQKFADRYLYMDKIVMWLKIAVSCLPAIVIGLPLDDWVEEHMHRPAPIAAMLILYGVLFIVVENYNKRRTPRVRDQPDHLEGRSAHRYFSGAGYYTRNLPLRSNYCGRDSHRHVPDPGGGVYFLSGGAHHAGSLCHEAGKVRPAFYADGSIDPDSGHGGGLCGFHPGY